MSEEEQVPDIGDVASRILRQFAENIDSDSMVQAVMPLVKTVAFARVSLVGVGMGPSAADEAALQILNAIVTAGQNKIWIADFGSVEGLDDDED